MALSLQEAVDLQGQTASIIGLPLRRQQTNLGLLAEISHLRETIEAKDEHINTLQTQLWSWRGQAMSEAATRHTDVSSAYERESELVRVIHLQMIEIERLQTPAPKRRRWFGRS
jgi:pyruvoyl-dependent arginine decarboxylase (PvlArgDC)